MTSILNLEHYNTLVFDCDGVLINSNTIKTQAYFDTAKTLGASDADATALMTYHIQLGGISRYHKFDYYLREILHQAVSAPALDALLTTFTQQLEHGLLNCELAIGLDRLRACTRHLRWMMVSGGDERELNWLFTQRGIATWFDGGIFGSPANKHEILQRERRRGNLVLPALFIGDSKYDFEAASNAGIDFVFLSAWSEVDNWQDYCAKQGIAVRKDIQDLLDRSLQDSTSNNAVSQTKTYKN
ncbi:MAG: HAD hydrolase-like protein [Methylophilaceae bacterium]|nr:HAD hydrolase-like protein [Methylophilaceae bacterium]